MSKKTEKSSGTDHRSDYRPASNKLRNKADRIGMVRQRASLATKLAAMLVVLAILGVLVLFYFILFR